MNAVRKSLSCFVIAFSLSFLGDALLADVAFYVDASRATNGDGTQTNPWKTWNDINWSTVGTALTTNQVKIYLSSRDMWADGLDFAVQTSGIGSNTLSIAGDEKYNLVDSGSASWQPETGTNRARLSGGGSFYVRNNKSYLQIKGLYVERPNWGGVVLGDSSPSTNIHHIAVTNCYIDSPRNNHGIWFGFAEAGCHSITISGCTVKNTPLEGIYLGHYNFYGASISNCVVEHNTLVDCGLSGEGDIDIKPAVAGAIVRYNTHSRTSTALPGSNCGVVCGANGCEIYGNKLYKAAASTSGDWGYGIYVNAEGSAEGVGQGINKCLIYNNLLYGNDRCGIKILATTSTVGADISGVRIWNNTIWGNAAFGLEVVAAGSRKVTIDELKNNILAGNSSYDIRLTGNALVLACDNNLYNRSSGSSWYYNGEKTFADWKALGFDAHGIVADPTFVDKSTEQLELKSGSPAIGAGIQASFFTSDIRGRARPLTGPWDLGAYQTSGPPPPTGVRVLQQ